MSLLVLTCQTSYTLSCRSSPEMVICGCPGACVSLVHALLEEIIHRAVFSRKTQNTIALLSVPLKKRPMPKEILGAIPTTPSWFTKGTGTIYMGSFQSHI